MNTDNFIITSSDIELAQNICRFISNEETRNRAVANAIAGGIAAKYFDRETYDIDSDSGLHNIGIVLEDLDISDIYINSAYIDVRVCFSEEDMSLPEEHFKRKLLPAAYMFIKISTDLSGASVIGFKNPENINVNNAQNGCIKVAEEELESFYDVEPLLSMYAGEPVDIDDIEIFAYLDNTIKNKDEFYSRLLKSKDGRLKLAKAAKAANVFRFVSINEDAIKNKQVSSNINTLDEQEFDFANEFVFEDSSSTIELEEDNTVDLNSSVDSLNITDTEISEEDQELDLLSDNHDSDNDELSLEDDNELLHESSAESNEDITNTQDEMNLEGDDLEIDLGLSELLDQASDTEAPVIEETSASNNEEVEATPVSEELTTEEESINTENDDKSGFEYSTVTSPSSDNSDILDELSQDDSTTSFTNQVSENSGNEAPEEQIDALFPGENEEDSEDLTPGVKVYSKKQGAPKAAISTLIILTILIVAGALGYTGYTKFMASTPPEDSLNNITPDIPQNSESKEASAEEAMPIETVETTEVSPVNNNEGVSASIPMIEQNLDASILVSNLKVDWEVPSGYASNTSAKRYLVKLGKIIQLNLKTELLLLSKPPITNKIAVEIKYNSGSKKFEATGVTISSGEKSVDDLILQTVNKALSMNLSMNTDSFAKLQGNPVLIIHL